MRVKNNALPVPKVVNPFIFSVLTTAIMYGVGEAGYKIDAPSAAAIVGAGVALVGYASPRG